MNRYKSHIKGILIALITVLSLWGILKLEYDFEIENLFPQQNDAVAFYTQSVLPFEGKKRYEVLGIQLDSAIFRGDRLARVGRLTQDLSSVEGIAEASSLTTIRYQRIRPFSNKTDFPFFYPGKKDRYKRDSTFFVQYTDVREKFLSEDCKAICIFLELDSVVNDSLLLQQIPQKVREAGFEQYFLNGSLQTNQAFTEALKRDMFQLSAISFALIILVLTLVFRSVWGVIFPLVIIALSVCWTIGILALLGFSLNTLTVVIPSMVAIVGMSDVIHVLSRYKEGSSASVEHRLHRTFEDIGQAIFFTSVTTSLGFLTLVLADIKPIVEFGIGTALGVMIAYGLTRWVLPDLLRSRPNFLVQGRSINSKTITIPGGGTGFMNSTTEGRVGDKTSVGGGLRRWVVGSFSVFGYFFSQKSNKAKIYHQLYKHAALLILIACCLLLGGLLGMNKLKVDSLLYDEITGDDRYSASLRFFDQQFAGIRSVDLYIQGKDSFFELRHLKKLDSLEHYLLNDYQLKTHYSLVTQVKRIHRSFKGGHPRFFRLPESEEALKPIIAYMRIHAEALGLDQLLQHNGRSVLVRGRICDEGSFVTREKNRKLQAYLTQLFQQNEGFYHRISGRSALLDLSNQNICYHLGLGLLGVMIFVAISMGLLLRSIKMLAIALFVNALPLIMVAGLMGFLEIGLNMSTAVIFTIAFGIAVDDTIHFLSRFRSELQKGIQAQDAIRRTFFSTGRAIVLTSVVLIIGFGVLICSNFQATRTTGMLISFALLMAVFADVILLPVLLRYIKVS